MITNISDEQIFRKNLIRPPYYALRELVKIGNEVRATIPVEQPRGNERGVITFAESARHLAILGSCAVTLDKEGDESCLYIALEGRQKLCTEKSMGDSGNLYGIARGEVIDKRRAKAYTRLFLAANDELLYETEVDFYIIPQRIFARKYFDFRQENPSVSTASIANPYGEVFPLYDISLTREKVSFSLGVVRPEYCCGHFPDYPVLPLAVLGYYQSKAISLLLDQLTGLSDTPYLFNSGVLRAHNFAFAGTKLIFLARSLECCGDVYLFESEVVTPAGEKIADATVTLTSLEKT